MRGETRRQRACDHDDGQLKWIRHARGRTLICQNCYLNFTPRTNVALLLRRLKDREEQNARSCEAWNTRSSVLTRELNEAKIAHDKQQERLDANAKEIVNLHTALKDREWSVTLERRRGSFLRQLLDKALEVGSSQ